MYLGSLSRWASICTEFTEFVWTFSIVLYSKKHDVSETGSVSVLKWRWGRRHLLSWAPQRELISITGIPDDGKSPDTFCEFCTTYTIVRILSSLSGHIFVSQSNKTLCGLVVRVPVYRSRGPGFDSRCYQIFWEVVGLERSPLSHVRIFEKLLEKTVAAPV
jgi:hypothetical protein